MMKMPELNLREICRLQVLVRDKMRLTEDILRYSHDMYYVEDYGECQKLWNKLERMRETTTNWSGN